ncbi:MAG: hypothetical protein JWM40_2809 [Frankiales bacterium]|nr:hypothetical protein [Frankiales bacterium]
MTEVPRRPPPTEDELRLIRLGVAPFIAPGARLTQLPAKHSKRMRVLEHIVATSFSGEHVYDEATVNELLARWCDGVRTDHVTVRRYLVDYGLMTRTAGAYRLA